MLHLQVRFLFLCKAKLLFPWFVNAVPPSVTSRDPRDIIALEYHDQTLQCEVQGYPPPQITWHHNGQQVRDESITVQQTFAGNSSSPPFAESQLWLRTLSFEQRGVYSCNANSNFSALPEDEGLFATTTKDFNLSVYGKRVLGQYFHFQWNLRGELLYFLLLFSCWALLVF